MLWLLACAVEPPPPVVEPEPEPVPAPEPEVVGQAPEAVGQASRLPSGITWVGDTVSAGNSPLQVCVDAWDADKAVIEIWWKAFDRVTAEQEIVFSPGCGGDQRVGEPCSSVDTRLHDPHPVYDYVDDTRIRCVRGDGMWCKLQYTGWFELRPGKTGCAANRG